MRQQMYKDKHCQDCFYYRNMYDCAWYCAYIFVEDKKRPCPPGKECTVKIRRKDRKRGTEDGK